MGASLQARTFLSLKAFGDLVILACVLGRLTPESAAHCRVAYARHLAELYDALGSPVQGFCLDTGASLPALYDVRRRGSLPAIRSLFEVRRAVGSLPPSETATLVFDHWGVREFLLGLGRPVAALPQGRANVYLAYEEYLLQSGATFAAEGRGPSRAATTGVIGIFPGSRIDAKRLSGAVVRDLVAMCSAAGWRCRIHVLDGESVDASMPAFERVPRRFEAMIDAVRSSDRIISADSLPAHLAEYFHRPVFVVSHRRNEYWLPRSSFHEAAWSLAPLSRDDPRLARFLGAPA